MANYSAEHYRAWDEEFARAGYNDAAGKLPEGGDGQRKQDAAKVLVTEFTAQVLAAIGEVNMAEPITRGRIMTEMHSLFRRVIDLACANPGSARLVFEECSGLPSAVRPVACKAGESLEGGIREILRRGAKKRIVAGEVPVEFAARALASALTALARADDIRRDGIPLESEMARETAALTLIALYARGLEHTTEEDPGYSTNSDFE